MKSHEFKSLRQELKLTQIECAKLLGCGARIIGRYENAKSPIPNVIGKYLELYKYTRNLDVKIISAMCETILNPQIYIENSYHHSFFISPSNI